MTTPPTVFILGAGASEPYGLPTGSDLTEYICDGILRNPNEYLKDCPATPEVNRKILRMMAENLNDIKPMSIDKFLEINPRFKECGTTCIAREIASKEAQKSKVETDWIAYLWDYYLVTKDPRDLLKHEVHFVTFNYDRSLENRLFSLMKSSYSLLANTDIKALQAVAREFVANIIHVHGQIGLLEWQQDNGEDEVRDYKADNCWDTAMKFAKKICIVTDADRNTREYKLAHEQLSKAQRIYFLGFGYHEENMKRLMPQHIVAPAENLIGTALNLDGRVFTANMQGNNACKRKITLLKETVIGFLKGYVQRD